MTAKELNSLVKQLQNNDMSVFDDIYHETKSMVYYTILNIIKSKDITEDLMQDAYLKALNQIHSFKPIYSFKSWIVMIARNLALNEYNKRKRELSFDPVEDEYIFGSKDNNSLKELIVKEMLESIDEESREIVILHVVGDMKHREIAALINKPLGTVTWLYNKAIKELREKFRE